MQKSIMRNPPIRIIFIPKKKQKVEKADIKNRHLANK